MEHPEDDKCKHADDGGEEEFFKAVMYCMKHPQDVNCQEAMKYCTEHPQDGKCKAGKEFIQYCTEHPEDEKCKPADECKPHCANWDNDCAGACTESCEKC